MIANYKDDENRILANILRAKACYDCNHFKLAKNLAQSTLELWPNCSDADKKDMQELIEESEKCITLQKVDLAIASGRLALSILEFLH